jgi:hypothetical protein
MADLIIKTATGDGNKLILQDKAGGAVLTTADSGATIANATIPTITGDVTITGDLVPSTPLSHRNMVINGGMNVAQRATSVTSTNSTSYHTVDRFNFRGGATGVYTIEQSTDAPANFKNSTKITVTTPDGSVPSTSRYWVSTNLEGNDISHLNLGTSDAQQFTLSFYVKSSLTGTFSGGFTNNGFDRAYAFTYNISSANTWERKEITLTGDTTGTWLTTNSTGIRIIWSLGWGTAREQSAGAWSANSSVAAIGAVQVIATNAATFQITGVQLELGSNATPFEYRSYGDELARCQRYCYVTTSEIGGAGRTSNTNGVHACYYIPASMRAVPTFNMSPGQSSQNYRTLTHSAQTTSTNHSSVSVYQSTGAMVGIFMELTGSGYWSDARTCTLQFRQGLMFTAEL